MPTNPRLEAALAYAGREWRVIRLHGKYPTKGSHGYKDGTTDPKVICAWWAEDPRADVGIATGGGLVVLDVDGPEGIAQLQGFVGKYGPLPATYAVQSGRAEGRSHIYSRRAVRSRTLGNIEIKCEGRYVVAPPSSHRK